ncbi:adenylyltransferase/cytidyltransferase family protein, partial [Candidatus Pelagibacter sp.]|nr:adenylyltransferase/cytidyltransferase family protein [Candidatus Pelagibacter sp.]
MSKKIIKFSKIERLSFLLKKKGKKIVLCHGVFDLLHLGHLRHFKEAKEYGDVLFVSITEDKYINKGFNRPYFNTQQRLEALSLINSVDYVFINNSKDAIKSIKELRPNIYCKGPDYKDRNSDITNKIKKEEKECLKNDGIIKFTKSETFSSSKLLNSVDEKSDKLQKYLIELKLNDFSKKIIETIDGLNKKEIVLIGETIIDKYNFCETLGKSGKEPHLVLKNINEEIYLGGVIAIAKNLAPLCKLVKVVSVLGEKKEYLNFIKKELPNNVKLDFIYKKNSSTI